MNIRPLYDRIVERRDDRLHAGRRGKGHRWTKGYRSDTDGQKDTEATQAPGIARKRPDEAVGARRENTGTNQGSAGSEPPLPRMALRPSRKVLHAVDPEARQPCCTQSGEG
jgi:hypothetical protein